ncbi:MAG: hypothetical protein E7609_07995 [Ruminococcaceae bacterium]|nr:hypothetical protein [Oscillospiraceae bacterium]
MYNQIEEMAKLACSVFDGDCHNCSFSFYPPCPPKASAERLYNAGYRKQSEGEWVKRGNEKTCSLCKFIYYSNNDEWNFCPNCGAHMSGGKNG